MKIKILTVLIVMLSISLSAYSADDPTPNTPITGQDLYDGWTGGGTLYVDPNESIFNDSTIGAATYLTKTTRGCSDGVCGSGCGWESCGTNCKRYWFQSVAQDLEAEPPEWGTTCQATYIASFQDPAVTDTDGDGINDLEDYAPNNSQVQDDPNIDTDGDGIPDAQDPNPMESDAENSFDIVMSQQDASGNTTFIVVEDADGNQFTYGEQDAELPITLNGGDDNMSIEDLAQFIVDENLDGTPEPGSNPTSQQTYLGPDVTEYAGAMDQKADNTDNATDTDILDDIESNTGSAVNNQKVLANLLQSIHEGVQAGNALLNAKDTKGASAGDIGEAVVNAGNATQNASTTDIESQQVSGWAGPPGEGEYTNVPEYGDEEVSWFSSFLDDNPYKTALSNSGIQTSGSTATATLNLGSLGSHEMDLGPLQSGLQQAGIVLLALTTLTALILVVKG